ncbi:MAG: leucine-rich repeat domain-containing protein, partial [Bacteroidetes bacterium]
MRYRQIVLLIAILSLAVGSSAQEQEEITPQQTEEYTEQSKQIIHFLEGTLNFLGDDTQLPSDKDVIINSSYLKFFKDDKVQIEDDLDENREIQISKDVQAYLKDIDFFFKEVTFTFNIDKVEQLVNEKGEIYFKVTM